MLAGGSRFLRQAAPVIVLSLHGPEQARLCAEALVSFGYALFHPDGTSAAPSEVPGDEVVAMKGAVPPG